MKSAFVMLAGPEEDLPSGPAKEEGEMHFLLKMFSHKLPLH